MSLAAEGNLDNSFARGLVEAMAAAKDFPDAARPAAVDRSPRLKDHAVASRQRRGSSTARAEDRTAADAANTKGRGSLSLRQEPAPRIAAFQQAVREAAGKATCNSAIRAGSNWVGRPATSLRRAPCDSAASRRPRTRHGLQPPLRSSTRPRPPHKFRQQVVGAEVRGLRRKRRGRGPPGCVADQR